MYATPTDTGASVRERAGTDGRSELARACVRARKYSRIKIRRSRWNCDASREPVVPLSSRTAIGPLRVALLAVLRLLRIRNTAYSLDKQSERVLAPRDVSPSLGTAIVDPTTNYRTFPRPLAFIINRKKSSQYRGTPDRANVRGIVAFEWLVLIKQVAVSTVQFCDGDRCLLWESHYATRDDFVSQKLSCSQI